MSSYLKRKILIVALMALGALLLIIQLFPGRRINPPVESEVPANEEVRAILRRACYDCHSHETRWPWYSRIAPVSWLVAHDVNEGRSELNFSTWNKLSPKKQLKAMEHIWEEIDESEMPLWYYIPLHPTAKLSADDLKILREWTHSYTPVGE